MQDPDVLIEGVVNLANDASRSFIAGVIFMWTLCLLNVLNARKFSAFGIEFDLRYRGMVLLCYTVVNGFFAYRFLYSFDVTAALDKASKAKLFDKITIGGPLLFSGFTGLEKYYYLPDKEPCSLLITAMSFGLGCFFVSEWDRYGLRHCYQGYASFLLGLFNWWLGGLLMFSLTGLKE